MEIGKLLPKGTVALREIRTNFVTSWSNCDQKQLGSQRSTTTPTTTPSCSTPLQVPLHNAMSHSCPAGTYWQCCQYRHLLTVLSLPKHWQCNSVYYGGNAEETPVQSQAGPCDICGGDSVTGTTHQRTTDTQSWKLTETLNNAVTEDQISATVVCLDYVMEYWI